MRRQNIKKRCKSVTEYLMYRMIKAGYKKERGGKYKFTIEQQNLRLIEK